MGGDRKLDWWCHIYIEGRSKRVIHARTVLWEGE